MDRCMNCDARYCGPVCHADTPGYVYVNGAGWVTKSRADELEKRGCAVQRPVNA